jgi:Tol biopolymer transport system component
MNFLTTVMALLVILQSAEPSARELFERAHALSGQNRNLEEAIQLYGQAASRGGKQRDLAAKATYEQGMLYLRLGKQADAERAFNTVIRDFSDQAAVVGLARKQLPSTARMQTRQVWASPETDTWGAISPDGRFLSFTDWKASGLAVRELSTGATRIVAVRDKGEREGGPLWSIFSPDGKRLAYTYEAYGIEEIRLVNVNGGASRTIFRGPLRHWVRVDDWSPDGKFIVAEISGKEPNGTGEVILVTVADGSMRVLPAPDFAYGRTQFSKDGRFIAYDVRPTGQERGDVYMTSLEDGRVEKLIAAADSDDRLIGWTPDGSRLLFMSDSSGSPGLWSVRVSAGKAASSPELLHKDLQLGMPLGLTKSGSLYYSVSAGNSQSDVYIADIDLAARRIAGAHLVSPRYAGDKAMPAWSPDGNFLAYLADHGKRLVIASIATGQERELRPNLIYVVRVLTWTPDGQAVVIQGTGAGDQAGTFAVDIQTGDAKLLLSVPDRPSFSADFTKAYWGNGSVANAGVFVHDLKSGEDRLLYKPQNRIFTKNISNALSPDGKWLAILLQDVEPAGSSLAVMPSEGGAPRVLIHNAKAFGGMNLNWTPDSQAILFVREGRPNAEVWLSPLNGESAPLNLAIPGDFPIVLRLNARGNRIAYTVSHSGDEVWVIENFLSP